MENELTQIWALSADLETLQLRMDAARLILNEAAAAALRNGTQLAKVSEAAGLSQSELLDLGGRPLMEQAG